MLIIAAVTSEKATHIYPGSDKPSVDQLDLKIENGELLVLVGPSGCGEFTPLHMLVGFEGVNEGHIFIGGKGVTDVLPKNHDIVIVFQNYTLYPYMTVRENMGFVLKVAGTSKKEIAKRVEEVARILDLEPYLDHKPKALSGGQHQRVAMGRAIVHKPQVFLVDEPLPNFDTKLRAWIRTQIVSLQRQLGVTTIYVTHDQMEAPTMGDRIAVLKDGLLQQVGPLQEMHERSANEFVAGFIGSPATNLGKFRVEGSAAALNPAHILLSTTMVNVLAAEDKGMIMIGFRPEGLELVSETEANSIPIQVDFVEKLGSDTFVYGHPTGTDGQGTGSVEEGLSKQLIARVPPRTAPARGSVAYIRVIAGRRHDLSTSTGMRLPE